MCTDLNATDGCKNREAATMVKTRRQKLTFVFFHRGETHLGKEERQGRGDLGRSREARNASRDAPIFICEM